MKRSSDDVLGGVSSTTSGNNVKKPVFLTKAQREQLALQRRQEEVSEQKRRAEEEQLLQQQQQPQHNHHHHRSSRGAAGNSPSHDSSSRHHRSRDRDHRERESERRNREREREEESKSRERSRVEKQVEREREKELESIKDQYLGTKKPKKRVIRPSEKFRFSFDWENTEDTSRDMNALYQNPHEAQLLFGRGFRAGMDRREQKKLAAKNEKDMRDEIRKKDGIEERPEEAAAQKQKEDAADLYDTFDMRIDRHWSEKKLEEMTERDWRIFREDFNISYKGSKIPRPMRNWKESKLTPELLKAVDKVGYKTPSPIQMAAIPLGLQQRDVIGIAETGSGKTAAFVLPMLTYISKLPPMNEDNEAEGPYAVVMAPTRELAQQIEDETVKFAHHLGIKVVSIVGGQSIEEQGFKIRQGCEVVIATPGRLIDCLERRYAVLNQCNYVVLDEADRMIDMGFEPQVVGVLDAMPSSNLKPENEDEELDAKKIYRTTYMFSATMPPTVERLARKYLRNPVVVTIGTAGKATELITQNVIMVKESEKLSRLQRLLNELGDKTAIVFINTKKAADSLSKNLDKFGYRVTALHGGKSQDQREISLEGFRTKRFNVLVATDVAGRGIDIPDVAHVINYDMPGNIEMYTHRIGRTGRAGKTGVATTFLTLHDTDVFYDLKQMLTQSNSPVPPELARHEASKFKPGSIPDRPARRNDMDTSDCCGEVDHLSVEDKHKISKVSKVHAYERMNRVYNYSLDPCGPVYITAGDGGNIEKVDVEHADDPGKCPSIGDNTPEFGGVCHLNFSSGPAKGRFCWDKQPEWSAFRESSFGHGMLEVLNSTYALWTWHRNQDIYKENSHGDFVQWGA